MTQEELITELVEEVVKAVEGPAGDFKRNIKGEFFRAEESTFCETCWGEGKVTYDPGHDDEYTEPCPDCHSGDKGDNYDNQE